MVRLTGQPKLHSSRSVGIANALTIDVEDYFHVSAFETVSPPHTWNERECRVEQNTIKILRLLDETEVKATFFVLGWVAKRYPGLVRELLTGGHEVASHGYGHRRVYNMRRLEFREDVRRSKLLLEDITGEPVMGYRAPSYSISQDCLWAFDELCEAGYIYDSSVFPIRHDLYGIPDWPRFPFVVERLDDGNWVPLESGQRLEVSSQSADSGRATGVESRELKADSYTTAAMSPGLPPSQPSSDQLRPSLIEVPITTLKLFGRSCPISGGGYFRLFPYDFTRWGLRRINQIDSQPFIFYLHPWELDPDQPRVEGASWKGRFRHYLNLDRTEERFGRLLTDFRFRPVREVLNLPPNSVETGVPGPIAGAFT